MNRVASQVVRKPRADGEADGPEYVRLRKMIDAGNLEGALEMVIRAARKAAFDPAWLLGEEMALPKLDELAAVIGQAVAKSMERPGLIEAEPSRFVHLVTDVVLDGAHGRILVDLVRARPNDQHVILVSALDRNLSVEEQTLMENAGAILVTAPPGTSLTKLQWMLLQLWRLRARYLVLFHHPHDAVIVGAAAVMERLYGRRMHVFYHYDYRPTLGLGFAGATYLTFRGDAADRLRQLLTETEIRCVNLMVRAEGDAVGGPRSDFLSRRRPVTCTCAREPKLTASSRYDFPLIIADVLATGGGRHIHIGCLSEKLVARVRNLMQQRGVPQDRFLVEPLVPSVARALREHRVDLFITSFPIGGGRTIVEAMCAGVPVAQFVNEEEPYLAGDELCYPDAPRWRSREELLDIIRKLSRRRLRKQSRASFAWYLDHHSPRQFRATLDDIFGVAVPEVQVQSALEGTSETRRRWRAVTRLARKVRQIGRIGRSELRPWSMKERLAKLAPFVDARYYYENYHDVRDLRVDPVKHYVRHGEGEWRSPCRLFSPKFYLAQVPDDQRDTAKARPLEHYVRIGERAGLKPHPSFDPELYARRFDDLGEGDGSILAHCLHHWDEMLRNETSLPRRKKGAKVRSAWGSRIWWATARKPTGSETAARSEFVPWSGEERRKHLACFVDARFYLETYDDVRDAGEDPIEHYLRFGESEWRSPCRLFSARFYLDQLPEDERVAAMERPLEHYVRVGERLGAKPHPLFDPELYASQLEEQGEDEGWILAHYLDHGRESDIDPHTFFRTRYYRRQMTVDPLQRTPLEHYLAFGDKAGLNPHILLDTNFIRSYMHFPSDKTSLEVFLEHPLAISPHPIFNTSYYLGQLKARRPKVKNALIDYLCFGVSSNVDAHPLFSSEYYRQSNPDIALRSDTPLEHFLAEGSRAGRDPHPLVINGYLRNQAPWLQVDQRDVLSCFMLRANHDGLDPNPLFSTHYYLLNNLDVLHASANPLVHYVLHGQYEGRLPHPAFDGNRYYRAYLANDGRKPFPLAHYFTEGASAFLVLNGTAQAQVRRDMARARRLFHLGGHREAEEALIDALHQESRAPHPMLAARSVGVQSLDCNDGAKEVSSGMLSVALVDSVEYWTPRPRIVARTHLSLPPGFVKCPGARLWELGNVTVIGGHSGVMTGKDTLLDEELARMDPNRHKPKQGGVVVELCADRALLRLQDTSEFCRIPRGLHLCSVYSRNYFHFLIEDLPRLLLSHPLVSGDIPVLVDEKLPRQALEALRLAAPGREIRVLRRNFCYQVDQLFYPAPMNFIYDAVEVKPQPQDMRLHPESLRRLNALADRTLPDPSRRRRLVLARRGATVRRLTNAHEIEEFLVARGFEVVDTATLGFQAQMRLMAEAEVVVAQSGAALANVVFARPGTRVVALFSNAEHTNYYLWSVIGRMLDLDVVNVAGWKHAFSAPEGLPAVHDNFNIPLDLLAPLVAEYFTADDDVDHGDEQAMEDEEDIEEASQDVVKDCLAKLHDAGVDADTLTSGWALLAEAPPENFIPRLADLRKEAALRMRKLSGKALLDLFETAFMRDSSRRGRTGLVLIRPETEEEQALCSEVVRRFQEGLDDSDEDLRTLLAASLYFQGFELPLLKDLSSLPKAAQIFYIDYLVRPPFLFRPGDDERYVCYVEELLGFLAGLLDAELDRDVKQKLINATVGLDLGNLVVIDNPLQSVIKARNALLEKVTKLAPKHAGQPLTKGFGKRRIGVFCRTFRFGPDSESLVSLFREFDKNAYEIYGYSTDFQDRVVRHDREFNGLAARVFDVRRIIPASPNEIIEMIRGDALDVFILANATTFGVYPIDIALYQRLAPIQMTLNSIVPIPPGFPSFDYFVTGLSDDAQAEIDVGAYREEVIRMPGPVICYLYSNQVKIEPLFDRAALSMGMDEVIFLNAGSLTKIRNECLETFLAILRRVPRGRLVLAPFNPGWVGRSQAYAFHIQVRETARRMGVDPSRITVMSEMSVAEAHRLVDLCDVYLTPFPHGGATMVHIALVQGKPPVVLRRRVPRSIDQFIVGSLGLNELLVNTPEEYVATATRLGMEPEARRALSARIAERAPSAPFIDNKSHSREFQELLDGILGGGDVRGPGAGWRNGTDA